MNYFFLTKIILIFCLNYFSGKFVHNVVALKYFLENFMQDLVLKMQIYSELLNYFFKVAFIQQLYLENT